MVVQELLRRARAAGVQLEPTDRGTLRLSGPRASQELVEELKRHKAGLLALLRSPAIGAGLIPRAGTDDPRYAGVDLVARSRDVAMLRIGIARLSLTPDDLSPELRATVERIAQDLAQAGSEELGRWATDVLYAYGDVPDLPEPVQLAAYHAWAIVLESTGMVVAAGEKSATAAT